MICDKWLHIYGNKLGTGANCEWVDDVRKNIKAKKVIGGGEHDGATCWFECSRCHGTVDIDDAYCKHCGAVLERGQTNEQKNNSHRTP